MNTLDTSFLKKYAYVIKIGDSDLIKRETAITRISLTLSNETVVTA